MFKKYGGGIIKTEKIKVEKIRKNLQKNIPEDKIVTKEDGTLYYKNEWRQNPKNIWNGIKEKHYQENHAWSEICWGN